MFSALLLSLVFLFILNMISPDAVIAYKNIDRYHKTGTLDTSYLTILSEDAIPQVIKLLDETPTEDVKSLAYYLNLRREKISAQEKNWQSFNFAKDIAIEKLNQKIDYLKLFEGYQPKR